MQAPEQRTCLNRAELSMLTVQVQRGGPYLINDECDTTIEILWVQMKKKKKKLCNLLSRAPQRIRLNLYFTWNHRLAWLLPISLPVSYIYLTGFFWENFLVKSLLLECSAQGWPTIASKLFMSTFNIYYFKILTNHVTIMFIIHRSDLLGKRKLMKFKSSCILSSIFLFETFTTNISMIGVSFVSSLIYTLSWFAMLYEETIVH